LTQTDLNTQVLLTTEGVAAKAGSFANQQASRDAELPIQGNSGCRVQIKHLHGRLIVEKSALDVCYSKRLKQQIQKQHRSRLENTLPFIRIPQILHEDEQSSCYRAEMEYVYFHNSLTFFSSASIPAIDAVANMIFAYIDSAIATSITTQVPAHLLLDKIHSIRTTLLTTPYFSRYDHLLNWLAGEANATPFIELPVGRCHGDLTFSNIMIASDATSLALIDFLDSFLDSPIIDLAKLRQDTLFHWTLLMGDGVEDRVRFAQVMHYLDRAVQTRYGAYDWYNRNIDMVLALNMLRISPYAKTSAVHDFLLSCLNSLRTSYD
jgi:thiamine kinase-like enzyme